MGTNHNLLLMYGFFVHDPDIRIPTRLGESAPTLREFFETLKVEHNVSERIELLHAGRMSNDPVPFIGIVIERANDVLRSDTSALEMPRNRVNSEFYRENLSVDEEHLSWLRKQLGCQGDIRTYVLLEIA